MSRTVCGPSSSLRAVSTSTPAAALQESPPVARCRRRCCCHRPCCGTDDRAARPVGGSGAGATTGRTACSGSWRQGHAELRRAAAAVTTWPAERKGGRRCSGHPRAAPALEVLSFLPDTSASYAPGARLCPATILLPRGSLSQMTQVWGGIAERPSSWDEPACSRYACDTPAIALNFLSWAYGNQGILAPRSSSTVPEDFR